MNENQSLALTSEPQPSELIVKAPIPSKTSQQTRVDEVAEALLPAYQKASELKLTKEENRLLQEAFADEMIEIRPHDGLLYIPHIHVSDRLIRVLGAGQWAMVRRREWIEGNRIYAEYVMVVRGCFVGESVGAMEYHPSNPRMNYSDALEGTRGECIRRIAAKDLGCGSQVWNPEFCRQWIAKYAFQSKGKWERKAVSDNRTVKTDVPQAKSAPEPKPPSKPPAPAQASEEQKARWLALLKPLGHAAVVYGWEKGWILGPGVDSQGNDTPGEPLEVMGLEHVPTGKTQAQTILGEIQARMDPQDDGDLGPQKEPEIPLEPEPELEDGVETMVGKLEQVSTKEGRSAKGPWKRFGLRIGKDFWVNTFSATLGKLAEQDKGNQVRVLYKAGEKGNDLVGIERAKQS